MRTATTTVMITTKNRMVDLRRTLAVLCSLRPVPGEVILTADGCIDETAEMVRTEFPWVKLVINKQGKGSVASRDRMMREAVGDLVLALDDDSYPEQMDCLSRIIPLFEARPRLAVLHFPQRSDEYPASLSQQDFGPERLTRSFANSGAVLRRSTYLSLAGFEPMFYHMFEEPDYALQCVGAGYEVLFAPILTIRHHYTPKARSELRNHQLHSRNEFWSCLMRCPFPHVLFLIVWRALSQLRYACRRGFAWLVREPRWWWQALLGIPYCLKKRRAMAWRDYKRWLALK